jgi:hypothetical protein
VIDGTSGDIVPVTLQRLAGDNLTVLQAASPVAVGDAVSLRWETTTSLTVVNQHSRVDGTCATPCGSDDVYRVRALETTIPSPLQQCGSQVTVLVMQNPASYPIAGHVWFWNTVGGALGSQAFNLAARQTFVLNTAGVPGVAGHAGRSRSATTAATATSPARRWPWNRPRASASTRR